MDGQEAYEVVLFVHHETDKAYLVTDEANGKRRELAVWLPKSQCERGVEVAMERGYPPAFLFLMPQWLADKKGL